MRLEKLMSGKGMDFLILWNGCRCSRKNKPQKADGIFHSTTDIQ